MTRRVLWLVIAAIVAVAAYLAPPRPWAAPMLLGVVGAETFVAVIAAARPLMALRRARSPFEAALATPPPQEARPGDLERIERALGWGSYSAEDFDHRVRPLLARALQARVGRRRAAAAAEEDLPDELVLVSRGARGNARTIDTPTIERIVDRLEEL